MAHTSHSCTVYAGRVAEVAQPPRQQAHEDEDEDEGIHEDKDEDNHPGFGCSPRRMLARSNAFKRMKKRAAAMQKDAARRDGGLGLELPVGTIVSIPIADVDRSKVDSTTATAVIVEVVHVGKKDMVKYRLACAAGTLKTLRSRPYINPLPNMNAHVIGLADALRNWKSMPEVGDRACSRFVSMVGGQGLVHCLCTTMCDSMRCSCFKANRECNSRCHKNNCLCVNKRL